MSEGVLFNCNAWFEKDEKNGQTTTAGNCTEQGLLKFLLRMKVDAYSDIRKKDNHELTAIPFNSSRKRACTAIRDPTD